MTLWARTVDGDLVLPTEERRDWPLTCPGCYGVLFFRSEHVRSRVKVRATWFHQTTPGGSDCDSWYDLDNKMSDWHIEWQRLVPPDMREVRITRGKDWHRADIRAADGQIVEVQHSYINSRKIKKREEFYGRMVWIWDLTEVDLQCALLDPEAPGFVRFEWGAGVRNSILRSERQAFFDLGGDRILQVGGISYNGETVDGWGWMTSKAQMIEWINSGPPSRLFDPMVQIKKRRAQEARKKAAEEIARIESEREQARIRAAEQSAHWLAEREANAERWRQEAQERVERIARELEEEAERSARRTAEQRAEMLRRDEELRALGSSLDQVLEWRDRMPVLSRHCSDAEMVRWGRSLERHGDGSVA